MEGRSEREINKERRRDQEPIVLSSFVINHMKPYRSVLHNVLLKNMISPYSMSKHREKIAIIIDHFNGAEGGTFIVSTVPE